MLLKMYYTCAFIYLTHCLWLIFDFSKPEDSVR